MSSDGLRELEHLVLLAISRLEPPAHGVLIVKGLEDCVDPIDFTRIGLRGAAAPRGEGPGAINAG